MKTKLFLLIAIVILMASIGWVGHAQKQNEQWDYAVIHTYSNADLQGQLNGLGATGWQLVSATEFSFGNPGQSNVTLYLKRAK